MDLKLGGKVAVVSGASRGLGYAIAHALGREGARVVISSRDPVQLASAVDKLEADGVEARGVAGDMSVDADVQTFVQAARDTYGPVDIAVSNVLPPHKIGFDACSNEDFIAAHQTMMMSVIYLARAVIPAMKERGWGRLININSHCSREPHLDPSLPLSNVTRTSVASLIKTISYELAPFGITANSLAVGAFSTERSKWFLAEMGITDEAEFATTTKRIPVQRFGRPEELGALAAFLASEWSDFITGESIRIDGGMSHALF
ncbi:SDR family oxidoreductase [Pseudonocardia sp.]|uniref:SDR family oxidoreductase n=1 Tax=Pseudonocardia sp. TaxID=60912 RepID=UPI003D0B7F22